MLSGAVRGPAYGLAALSDVLVPVCDGDAPKLGTVRPGAESAGAGEDPANRCRRMRRSSSAVRGRSSVLPLAVAAVFGCIEGCPEAGAEDCDDASSTSILSPSEFSLGCLDLSLSESLSRLRNVILAIFSKDNYERDCPSVGICAFSQKVCH
jgi:hypothetical protein